MIEESLKGLMIKANFPEIFGFRNGTGGAHSSRTIMLKEISTLFDSAPSTASQEEYARLIIEENVLGKKTLATRRESVRRLRELYGLDPGVDIFYYLRFFWAEDRRARPLLALLCSSARDPLLRMTAEAILPVRIGDKVSTGDIEAAIHSALPNHFKPPVQHAIARHAASSWQQAGFLSGRIQKIRQKPLSTPATAAYALLLGYFSGASGQFLFRTFWARLLDIPDYVLQDLARDASRQSWLTYKALGDVMEIDFSILLNLREGNAGNG